MSILRRIWRRLTFPWLNRLITTNRLIMRYIRVAYKWFFSSNELTNYTYELTVLNERYLIAFVATITQQPHEVIAGYVHELKSDQKLKDHIRKISEQHKYRAIDKEAKFGRRMGWYAFVRAMKPAVVIETGIDKGLGACVLSSALMRNAEEGHQGRYYGTDINPRAGYLFKEPYNQYGEILYGDSIESLKQFAQPINLFINDSDHSAEYEAAEYETIKDKLAPDAIILGDNAEITDKLLCFTLETGRQFLYFHEQPDDHWYPGGGIGVAFSSNKK